MGFLPRRRSFIFKLVLAVPVFWLFAVLVFNYQDRLGVGSGPGADEARLRREIKLADDKYAAADQILAGQKLKEKAIGGPPIKPAADLADGEEGAGSGPSDDNPQGHNRNIPQPRRFVDDADNPIYKKDPSMPGEMGKPVNVKKEELAPDKRKLYDDGWQNNAFNQYASDQISVHRSLPEFIDKECKTEKYSESLPDTSVIVCFHNEAWSVLLRTVHSIINRTPSHLLKEIILVDDFSDKDHTKKPLEDYMAQFPKVKILRMEKREGLIRARLKGAAAAKGKVLTYLDSHCECMEGWAEPLLDRIKKDPHTVVCPVIDVIDDTTFEYHYSKAYFTNVGGFDWSLQFNWHPIPERDRKNRKRDIDPVPSPTMAGGLFSIDRDYFEYLGTYDPGFDIWGGENLELSFKIWMCGGRLEIVPCSHVGHIFRKRSPYKWRSGVNVLKRNTIRLAEVWLDEYKKYYYERINFNLGDYGDISDRKALRERISCKSFRWYLDTIFPELFIPGDAIASGEYWMLSKDGEIRRDESCIDYAGQEVMIFPCHGMKGNQHWKYDHKRNQLLHVVTSKCIEMTSDGSRLTMQSCEANNEFQQWVFKTYDAEKASAAGMLR